MITHLNLSRRVWIVGLTVLTAVCVVLPGAPSYGQEPITTPGRDRGPVWWPLLNDSPGNGFADPLIGETALPVFTQLETGVEDYYCHPEAPGPASEVQLYAEWLWWDGDLLCLYELGEFLVETGDDLHAQDFAITLIDPLGVSYRADFLVQETEDRYLIITNAATGEEIGNFYLLRLQNVDEYQRYTYSLSRLKIPVYFAGDLCSGEWQVVLTTAGDDPVFTSTVMIDDHPVFTVLPAGYQSDPFAPPYLHGYGLPRYSYHPGDQFVIVGRGYEPGAEVVVALYTRDEPVDPPWQFEGWPWLGLPRYATTVMPDDDGRFAVEFTVNEDTLPSEQYYVLVGDMLTPSDLPSANMFVGNHIVIANEAAE